MKITKNKFIAFALILIVLITAFWYGGGAPGLQGWDVDQSESSTNPISTDNSQKNDGNYENKTSNKDNISTENSDKKNDNIADKDEKPKIDTQKGLSASEKIDIANKIAGGNSSASVEEGSKSYSESQGMLIDSITGKDKYLTDPVPEGKPIPVEPQNATITDVERTCTLSVRCDTILDNMDWLDKEKIELVPKDGVIFATKTVTFYEGESVFNVLQREMKKAKIHMEFTNTPIYNSVYIEGINNLYEFDSGELSGWMYKVNDWFPNYGCSRYQLKEGDVIEWVYTCNLGIDVGGFHSVGD